MEILQVPHPEATDLGDQLAIPLYRRELLSKQMDAMVKELSSGGIRIVTLAYFLAKIQEHCFTQEEFTWCTCNHVAWLHRTKNIF